jgi:hypothetical protein
VGTRGSFLGCTATGHEADHSPPSSVEVKNAWAGNFSPHHSVQTGTGAHQASYPMDNRGSFPGGKAAGT